MLITLVQSALFWENPDANREMFAAILAPLRGLTNLVVLPEMFTTGFSMNADHLAESMEGPTMNWMRVLSKDLDAAVTGSFICKDGAQCANRMVFMRPDGRYDYYDKKHLFSPAGENMHFVAGKKRLIVEWLGLRICPMICYDLRFPAWSRNYPGSFVSGLSPLYDILLYSANWPSKRAHHWRTLLAARAIENQAFVAGVNIVGTDGAGLEYLGDSSVFDYSGQLLVQASGGREGVFTVYLDRDSLYNYRQQLPFLADADAFEMKD